MQRNAVNSDEKLSDLTFGNLLHGAPATTEAPYGIFSNITSFHIVLICGCLKERQVIKEALKRFLKSATKHMLQLCVSYILIESRLNSDTHRATKFLFSLKRDQKMTVYCASP